MRKTVFALALLAGFAAHSQALIWGFSAPIIAGNQEVPPTSSTAYGTASYTVNDQTWLIQGTVNVWGLSPTAITGMHIHEAPVGVNGPVRFNIGTNSTTFNQGTFWIYAFSGTLATANNAAFLTTMINGGTYINVHTPAFPGGEIRGQVDCTGVVPEPATMAVLGLGVIPFLRRRRK
jgi:hypothetical protein